jgi:predicted nucleic acid-binding protein
MNFCVLDTSVLIKGIFPPVKDKNIELNIREKATYEKCKVLIRYLESLPAEIIFPRAGLVELFCVVTRIEDFKTADIVFQYANEFFSILDESTIFDRALSIARRTGCSGFDTYMLASASLHSCPLYTDDAQLNAFAGQVGIHSFLVRESSIESLCPIK